MEKKVYADYHGPRCTREHDKKLGQWKYYGVAQKSKVKNREANYNADCIKENGLFDLAALSYPLLGMQSQRDEDYIEFQILTAKLAHIDGFFVEWGFQEHESNEELLIMIRMAQKLGFEIGINWCDAWHFYSWIEEFHKDAISREKKIELFKDNVQYLIDILFQTEVGAKIDGHPLIFLFGGGINIEEFLQIKGKQYRLPIGIKEPYFFTRAAIIGREEGNKVVYDLEESVWTKAADGIFGWIPTRARNGLVSEEFSSWDRYATKEDTEKYVDVLYKAMDITGSKLRISCVNPEMDNRACASWNKHDLSYISRENGETYENMWKKNLEYKGEADIIYIISWNDYTECHQIEPTLKDGYRELETTRKYAAEWKEQKNTGDSSDFLLPMRLFYLRKRVRRLNKAGVDVIGYQASLDSIADRISNGKAPEALLFLEGIERLLQNVEKQIMERNFLLLQKQGRIKVTSSRIILYLEELTECMTHGGYDSWLSFSYLDETGKSFEFLHKDCKICEIKMGDTQCWKQAKIPIFQENIKEIENELIIEIKGEVQIKDIRYFVCTYQIWNE